jgi:hypothetical protein
MREIIRRSVSADICLRVPNVEGQATVPVDLDAMGMTAEEFEGYLAKFNAELEREEPR